MIDGGDDDKIVLATDSRLSGRKML
jgi:hypothetical protein